MRLAFVTSHDPRAISGWSGTPFFIQKELAAQGVDLHFIGPLTERFRRPFRLATVACRRLLGRDLLWLREPVVIEGYARQIEAALEGQRCDAIFSPGTIVIARVKTDLPIFIWTDATFASLQGYYKLPHPTLGRSLRLGMSEETRVLARVRAAVYGSEWAARSAVEQHHADPQKVHVIPFGANHDPLPPHAVDPAIEHRLATRKKLRLLMVGTDWPRKGGDRAVALAREIKRQGRDVELHAVGRDVPDDAPDVLVRHTFIDKSDPAGRAKLDALWDSAHVLIHLARAEAYGIVLTEAAARALPVLATRTGGIPTICRDDQTALLEPLDADIGSVASRLLATLDDAERYTRLSRAAYDRYRETLNWSTAVGRLIELMRKSI